MLFFPKQSKCLQNSSPSLFWEESTVVCIYHCDLKLHFISVL
uniref:Uncharacterized protein n=1 Tax=Anguilla anguilla TaxID=7936 RepID=A0A0E9PVK7_ANGAN